MKVVGSEERGGEDEVEGVRCDGGGGLEVWGLEAFIVYGSGK